MLHNACIATAALFLLTFTAAASRVEVKPAESLPCAQGVQYRKAVSALDNWTGIEAVVKLPDMANAAHTDATIALGATSAGHAVDCGVRLETTARGTAFRPFWRSSNAAGTPLNPAVSYQPGDIIRMKMQNTKDGRMLMQVDLLARDGDIQPVYATDTTTEIIATTSPRLSSDKLFSTIPADAMTTFTTVFDASEFRRDALKQMHRVNSIDPGAATDLASATWRETWLLDKTGRLPMTPARYTDMRCPETALVRVDQFGLSGEIVTLLGNH